MLIDIFLFCKEFDVLEIRLQELYNVVDKFILVEADHTFNNNHKPYYFDEYKGDRFDGFRNKIFHVKIPFGWHLQDKTVNKKDDHWIERQDRIYAMKILKDLGSSSDKVILADVDEIPSREYLEKIKNRVQLNPINIKTKLFRYYLNLYFQPWKCTHIMSIKYLEELNWDWYDIRKHIHYKFPITNGDNGWHFSHIGSVREIFEKIQCNCSYNEFKRNGWAAEDKIEFLVKGKWHRKYIGKDDKRGKFIPIKELPVCVQENSLKFAHILGK